MRDLRIGADCKAFSQEELREVKNEFAPNAPRGQEYLANTRPERTETTSILSVCEPIGALGAIGATKHSEIIPHLASEKRRLTPEQREVWDERMAICTIDGGLSEAEAEVVSWAQLEAEFGPFDACAGGGS
jgi:hypothetical protein